MTQFDCEQNSEDQVILWNPWSDDWKTKATLRFGISNQDIVPRLFTFIQNTVLCIVLLENLKLI